MVDKIIKTTHYKLILILDQLEPSEWRALKKFLLMYTRERSDNFDLFTLLRKHIDRLNTNEDVKQLHQEHFPQMTSKTFSNMMSRLTLWTEDWMVYEDMRKSDQRDIRLIRLYNSRGLYKESNAIANKAIKTAKNKPGLSLVATENLAKIYYYQYFSNNPIKYQQENLFDKLLKNNINNIKNYSMLLKNQFNFFGTTKTLRKQIEIDYLDAIIKLTPPTSETKLLKSVEHLLTNYDYKSLLEIKQQLEENKILFKSDLHIVTTMYVYNSGPTLWAKNKFRDPKIIEDILNYAIKSGVILTDEKIDPVLWHTMISIISTIHSFSQSKIFIDKWYMKVAANNFNSLHSLSMAQLCFHKHKYNEIRDHIFNIDHIEQGHKLRANSLVVISLYKDRNQNFKLFIDFANNFIRQLKRARSKIPSQAFDGYHNLVTTLLSLAASSFKESKVMIEDSRHIMYRGWLRNEIKKSRH